MATEKTKVKNAHGKQTAVNRDELKPTGKPTEPIPEPTPSAQEERRRKVGRRRRQQGRTQSSNMLRQADRNQLIHTGQPQKGEQLPEGKSPHLHGIETRTYIHPKKLYIIK